MILNDDFEVFNRLLKLTNSKTGKLVILSLVRSKI